MFILFIHIVCLPLCSRSKRGVRGGCYSKVALPLFENSSIVEQPLDLWTLTQQYTSTALRIINNARYGTVEYSCHHIIHRTQTASPVELRVGHLILISACINPTASDKNKQNKYHEMNDKLFVIIAQDLLFSIGIICVVLSALYMAYKP